MKENWFTRAKRYCPNCGKQPGTEDRSKGYPIGKQDFCPHCGVKVVFPKEEEGEILTCGNCGTSLFFRGHVDFCGSCGASTKIKPPVPVTKLPFWKRSKWYRRMLWGSPFKVPKIPTSRAERGIEPDESIPSRLLYKAVVYKCSRCGAGEDVTWHLRYCRACGGRVVALVPFACTVCEVGDLESTPDKSCPSCGRSFEDAMRPRSRIVSRALRFWDYYSQHWAFPICRHCDKWLPEGEAFCGFCGRSREEALKAPRRFFVIRLIEAIRTSRSWFH